ncbi:hypothetical protein KEM54_004276 [Ascosphaera aggregata]|nr:hypothetical protein KEM54_004276 [Ascosphaera aggregata]
MYHVAVQSSRNEQERQITALAEGFGALLRSSQKFAVLEKELRSRLSFARDEYINLLNKIGDRSAHEYHVCEKLHPDNISSTTVPVLLDVTQWISPAEEAAIITPAEVKAISKGVQTWKRVGGVVSAANGSAGRAVSSGLERDFTTTGVQGKLQCPFTAENHGRVDSKHRDTCGRPGLDPIKVQRNDGTSSSVGAPSAKGSAVATARCPIRYLDDHSPEEVAKYFESHKHDLPRSHAICIQRYQKDSQSLRQIDQKYGNMVTMIQGLGQYHKPYLEGDEKVSGDRKDAENADNRIRHWADDVHEKSGSTLHVDGDPEQLLAEGGNNKDDMEERDGRFERPLLREVRLGESPSRPWGIHVPLSHRIAPAESLPTHPNRAKESQPVIKPSSPEPHGKDPSGRSFSKGKAEDQHALRQPVVEQSRKMDAFELDEQPVRSGSSPPARKDSSGKTDLHERGSVKPEPVDVSPVFNPVARSMVFNGPVFFGFSADDTAALLQRLAAPESSHYVFGYTDQVYRSFARREKFTTDTVALKEGGLGHWIGDKNAKNVIIYFHGGGYGEGASEALFYHQRDVMNELNAAGKDVSIFFVTYGLSPMTTYPRQLVQGVGALRYIVEETERPPSNVALGGDSAGGNMCLAILSHINHPHCAIEPLQLTEPLAAVFVTAPWVSFDTTEPAMSANLRKDIVSPAALKQWSDSFLGGSTTDNYNEAINASADWWEGIQTKHLLICVGKDDVLFSGIDEFAHKIMRYQDIERT